MSSVSPVAAPATRRRVEADVLAHQFKTVRDASMALAAPLSPEDQVIQSMPDASPTKWHLAHITWFFETFVLARFMNGFTPHDPAYAYLFNSYYQSVGKMHARPCRGLLSRPTVDQVYEYRRVTDARVLQTIEANPDNEELAFLVTLGLHHEQQHQELLVTDIKHALYQNPMAPAYAPAKARVLPDQIDLRFIDQPHGVLPLGRDFIEPPLRHEEFIFDSETPRHEALIRPHALANRPVSNTEYRAFIDDGGYQNADLWLSDGWSTVNERGWQRPLYWRDDNQTAFTLNGDQPLDDHAPVCHVSFYEADAYARWAGARLPSEGELERAALTAPMGTDFADNGHLHPGRPEPAPGYIVLHKLYGGVWEWTQSPYAPYPGFKPLDGALGEYNGKFMCNQMILRGGSCATPESHIRATYRNFFYPPSRWQFSGIRLAKDTA